MIKNNFFTQLFRKKNTKNLEIERKFLLKDLSKSSQEKADFSYYIVQDYYKDEYGVGKRVRKQYNHTKSEYEYIVTEKRFIKKGINEEIEHNISYDEYEDVVKRSDRTIEKFRYVYKTSDGLKWEIDIYENIKMVTAEIELPSLSHKIEIPDFIKEVLIEEVTGKNNFSNFALAVKKT